MALTRNDIITHHKMMFDGNGDNPKFIELSRLKEEINDKEITFKEFYDIYNNTISKIKSLTYGDEKKMIDEFKNRKLIIKDVCFGEVLKDGFDKR